MTKGKIYETTITTGGGSYHHAGDWMMTALTPKTVKVQMIRKPDTIWGRQGLASSTSEGEVITISRENRGPHCLKDWGDGTFTVYANRDGTPHYFAPLQPKPIE